MDFDSPDPESDESPSALFPWTGEEIRGDVEILLSGIRERTGSALALLVFRAPEELSAASLPVPGAFKTIPSRPDTLPENLSRLAEEVFRKGVRLRTEDSPFSPWDLPESGTVISATGIPVRSDRGVEAVLLLGYTEDHPEDAHADTDGDPALEESVTALLEGCLFHDRIKRRLAHTDNRLEVVSRLYRSLSAVNTLILSHPGEKDLQAGTIRILIDMGGFTAAGFYEAEPEGLRLGLHHIVDPESDSRRHPLHLSLDPASPDALTGTVRCFRTETPVFINNLDEEYERLGLTDRLRDYRMISFRSTGLCPLFRGGRCTGVFALVSDAPGRFSPEIRELVVETSRLLSLALDRIDSERRREASEERLATLVDHLPDPILFKDGEGRWKTVNPAGLRLFGLEGSPVWHDRTDLELAEIYPGMAGVFRGCHLSDARAWEARSHLTGIEILPDSSGDRILEVSKIPLYHEDGSRNGLIVTARDVTLRRKDEEIRERYARIFEHTGEGIMVTDCNHLIVDVNPAFSRITGFSREEALGQNPRILRSGRQDPDFYEAMWEAISRDGCWEGEIWNRKRNGEAYCEWLSIFALTEAGKVTHYIGIFSDISHRKAGEMRIAYLATHDILTGTPNRGLFRERLDAAWEEARKTGRNFALGILDLDYFKEVNDNLGHAAGDRLLTQVTRRLERVLKSSDTLARLGGDEFGLLLGEASPEILPRLCGRLLSVLREPFDLGPATPSTIRISGSLGIVLSPDDPSDPETLLAHADLALYRAKGRGRDAWALFEPAMEERAREAQTIREEFSRALASGELVLHYQPQVDLHSGRIAGVEALVRWNHPVRGLLPPAAFIDVVESSNLTAALGRWVLSEALAQQSRWRSEGLPLRMSVNIGARHFLSEDFLSSRREIPALVTRNDDPEAPEILIEIPESEILRDPARARRGIEGCRNMGLRVSLDDFGTGQASIRTLQELAIDEVKIDRSFIRNLMEDPKDLAVVANLLRTARMLLIRPVAKGAESESEGQILAHLGCPVLQGSVLSLPLPSEEIPGWVASFRPAASWTEALRWPELDMEELSLLMVARAARDLCRRLPRNPAEVAEWSGWAQSRDRCLVCRWIDYTLKLLGEKAGEDFGAARTVHDLFHQRLLDSAVSQDGWDPGTILGALTDLGELGEEVVDRILGLCGKMAQNLSRSLL